MLRFSYLKAIAGFFAHILARFVAWSVVLVVSWWSAGAVLELPAKSVVNADAVVILGGGTGERYDFAKRILQSGFSERLFLTEKLPPYYQRDFSINLVNVDPVVIDGARNSWDEAVTTRVWMEKNAIQHVLVVSDPPHMLRLAYTWSSVFRGSDLRYTLVATSPYWWSSWRWWENERAAEFAGFEVLKLGYYVARYKFGWWGYD